MDHRDKHLRCGRIEFIIKALTSISSCRLESDLLDNSLSSVEFPVPSNYAFLRNLRKNFDVQSYFVG